MKRLIPMPWMLLVATLIAWPAAVHAQLRFVTVVPAAANTQFQDEDGDYPAYIEIRSLETGILSGHTLTDNPQVPNKWQFPAGYILTSGQTIRVFASGKDRRPTGPGGILHTSFTYDCNVPYCGLHNTQGALVHTFFDRTDRCGCEGLPLIKERSVVRYWVPTDDIGTDWTLPGFNDKGWRRGVTGLGYDPGTSPFLPGLVLYHTFDRKHVANGTVQDLSGPTLHPGTLGANPAVVLGRVQEALEFKGDVAQFVKVPHHPELDPGQGSFSVGFWFRPNRNNFGSTTAIPAFSEILVAKFGPNQVGSQVSSGWSVYRNQNGTFVQAVSAAGIRAVALGPTQAGQWHHAVLVINRSTSQLVGYLNGKRIGSSLLSGGADVFGTIADMVEGRDLAGVLPYTGLLDDLAIWNRPLGDAEVAQLFSAGQQGKSFLDPSVGASGSSLYAPLIGTDVLDEMRGVNASIYVRMPFHVPSVPAAAVGLRLRVHYDDGFILYLNGAEVARRNAPSGADFLSSSVVNRPDPAALAGEWIDLSSFVGLLKPGGNLLAFHALNHDPQAERFVIAPTRLCLEVLRTPPTTGDCVRETNGREFWITFPENYVQEPDTPLHLTLCIAGVPQTQGLVEIPGLNVPGYPRLFTIPPSGSLRMELPRAAELAGPDKIERKGIHILANAKVAVYGTTRMDYTTDSFLALPTTCLGVEYLVSTYRNVFDGIPVLNGSQFALVAVANGTEVTITPTAKVGTHPALVPYQVKLNRGETYQLRQEAGQPADLTGTRIVSNKPIGVFGSHRCANVRSVNQFFCDTIVEELLPVASWGTTYFVVPLATRKGDTLRILSSDNNNLVTVVTSAGSQSFNLQRGEHRDLLLELPTRINCRAPSLVMQFATSSDADHVTNADPFMTMIQPFNTWLSQYRLCTPPAVEFEDNYLHLIAQTPSLLDIATINGTALAAWNPADISKGALPTGFAYARVRLQPNTSYLVNSQAPLGMIAYGFSEFDSYGYPGGMRFEGLPTPFLTCPPDVTVDCQSVPGAAGCLGIVPDFTLRAEVFSDCGEKGRVAVTQKPEAGTALPPGTHTITVLVADGSGRTTECSVKFTVQASWASQQFGAATASNPALQATVWGAFADPDGDGLLNAMEEALGTDPRQKSPLNSVFQITTEADAWGTFPIVSFPRLVEGGALPVEVEGTGALVGSPWETGPDILEELPERNTPLPGGKHERAVFKIRQPISNTISNNAFFLRLKLND